MMKKEESPEERVPLIKLKFAYYETEIFVGSFIFVSMIFKIIYRKLPFVRVYVPESCMLILIGVAFGYLLIQDFIHIKNELYLSSNLFFLILLPPIVLQSSYDLHNSTFFANFGCILIFAVVGTLLSFIIISISLYGFTCLGVFNNEKDTNFDIITLLLFSSIIVEMDPVAVLSIFAEVGVNESLYFMVFGESLLNDAVTIVLYQIFSTMVKMKSITVQDYLLGTLSFFTVSLGGMIIGAIMGAVSSLLTRFTRGMESLEPMILLSSAYLGYVITSMFGWSGIIAIIVCGLIQVSYGFHNITWDSRLTLKNMNQMFADVAETMIFLFLGISVFVYDHLWHTTFIFITLFLCLISRLIVVCFLCGIINYYSSHSRRISWTEQAIMIYGGIRGAVSFSLATIVDLDHKPDQFTIKERTIVSTTLVIVLLTNFVMGITMKPLVHYFEIRLHDEIKLSVFKDFSDTIIHNLLLGVEEIIGDHGWNYTIHLLRKLDDEYIRPLLMENIETHNERIFGTYTKICLSLHQELIEKTHGTKRKIIIEKELKKKASKFIEDSLLTNSTPSSSVLFSREYNSTSVDQMYNKENMVREMEIYPEITAMIASISTYESEINDDDNDDSTPVNKSVTYDDNTKVEIVKAKNKVKNKKKNSKTKIADKLTLYSTLEQIGLQNREEMNNAKRKKRKLDFVKKYTSTDEDNQPKRRTTITSLTKADYLGRDFSSKLEESIKRKRNLLMFKSDSHASV